MKRKPYEVGSVLHIVSRGVRGSDIVRDRSDRWRFVRNLFLLNDHFQDINRNLRTSDVRKSGLFDRPESWPDKEPLVAILGWTLMSNHFHLLVQEIVEGGVSKFMQRFKNSMTRAFNEKYNEKGTLFQGPYKSSTIVTDEHLQYVYAYITVKNMLENYPGGLKKALKNFDEAWKWAHIHYPFSSFITASKGVSSPVIDMNALESLGLIQSDFKGYAKNMLLKHAETREELVDIFLEEW